VTRTKLKGHVFENVVRKQREILGEVEDTFEDCIKIFEKYKQVLTCLLD